MLFGHVYNFRFKVELEDGTFLKGKCPVEARFCSKEELVDYFKSAVEKEVLFETNKKIKRWINYFTL